MDHSSLQKPFLTFFIGMGLSTQELHRIILPPMPQWSSWEICSNAEEELETEFSADKPTPAFQPPAELPVNTTHYNWHITCQAFSQTAAESPPVNGETRPRGSSPSQAGEAEGAARPRHKDPSCPGGLLLWDSFGVQTSGNEVLLFSVLGWQATLCKWPTEPCTCMVIISSLHQKKRTTRRWQWPIPV